MIVLLVALSSANASSKNVKNYVIGFYNLENLFDIYDDPVKNDEEFLPEGKNKWTEAKYQKKLQNMAKVIKAMKEENGCWHTILGVSEIENRLVLEDLVADPQIAQANYQIVHYDGPDRRGVDVALLYRPDQFKFLDSESIPYTFDSKNIEFSEMLGIKRIRQNLSGSSQITGGKIRQNRDSHPLCDHLLDGFQVIDAGDDIQRKFVDMMFFQKLIGRFLCSGAHFPHNHRFLQEPLQGWIFVF